MAIRTIGIEKQIDTLTKEVFTFYVDDELKFYIDSYELGKRGSSRHKKYCIEKKYDRCGFNKRNYSSDRWIEEKDIPITQEIIEEVKQEIIKMISFSYWVKK